MIAPTRIPLPESFGALQTGVPDLVTELLAAQQSLTAVERFSAHHDTQGTDTESVYENSSFYRDLIPLREPRPGEQYAFEVDLDRCTGCKACVTACHNLNGLDEDETWRTVGLLQTTAGETPFVPGLIETLKPVHQHVTTACHHCADPGCAQGCPTLAYEKNPATGVVRHLDDQCFGCQYCILKCPYDVPQYNAARGIVRKCDLCIGRLRAGEAPACAQACPTQAIRVTLVDTAAVAAAPTDHFDLPGAPDPSVVHPTTRYTTKRGLSAGMIASDAAQARPEHAHLPLVFMLVASQAAAGYWILLILNMLATLFATTPLSVAPSMQATGWRMLPWMELIGALGVQAALGLSLLHLGRPWLAWKAVLGWRRSWLSREVIAFSALAATTGLYTLLAVVDALVNRLTSSWADQFLGGGWEAFGLSGIIGFARVGLGLGVVASALAALHASAMVYRDTPRALWATRDTFWKFALTAALCGLPAWLLVAQLGARWQPAPAASLLETGTLSILVMTLLPLAQLAKLALEMRVFTHREGDARGDYNPLWKACVLLDGTLRPVWTARAVLALGGGVFLPLSLLLTGTSSAAAWPYTAACLATVLAGELLERFLFFTTAVAPRMPGARR